MNGGRRSGTGGFSLLELIVALTLLAVLAALLLPARAAWRERLARTQAEAELAHLAAGLERYRVEHGDYPWRTGGTDDGVQLAQALSGDRAPDGVRVPRPRPVLDLRGFALGDPKTLQPRPAPGPAEGSVAFVILDPWGQPYRYAYRSGPGDRQWTRVGFLLVSTGPSGAALADTGEREEPFGSHTPRAGAPLREGRRAADDLYFGF